MLCDVLHGGAEPIVADRRDPPVERGREPTGRRTCSTPSRPRARRDAADLGALVCFAGELHAARAVRKVSSVSPAAFGSPSHGPIGRVAEGRVRIVARPCAPGAAARARRRSTRACRSSRRSSATTARACAPRCATAPTRSSSSPSARATSRRRARGAARGGRGGAGRGHAVARARPAAATRPTASRAARATCARAARSRPARCPPRAARMILLAGVCGRRPAAALQAALDG